MERNAARMIDVLKPHFTGKYLTTCQEALIHYVQQQPRQGQNGHINLHVHTNESFSFFQNPTEAVWYAYGRVLSISVSTITTPSAVHGVV